MVLDRGIRESVFCSGRAPLQRRKVPARRRLRLLRAVGKWKLSLAESGAGNVPRCDVRYADKSIDEIENGQRRKSRRLKT